VLICLSALETLLQGLQQLNTIIIDMAQYFDDSELQISACKAIHMIAQQHGNADNHIGAEGLCEAVIAAILKYPTDTDIAKWGWHAVSALSQCKPVHNFVNDNNVTRLYDVGVCNMIISAPNQYSNDSNMAPQILQTVNSLACSDSGIRYTLNAFGACDVICISSELRQNNISCAQAYCEAVYSLALDSFNGTRKLVNAGAIDALTDILHWHKTSADVITVACKAVRALRMINADSCVKLVCALNEHINKQGVAVAGCQVIQSLAVNDTNRVQLGNAGACELLAKVAKTHSNNTVVLVAVYKAMHPLAIRNNAYGHKLNCAKVHISVISAITLYMGNAELVKFGCLVLLWLSYSGTTEIWTSMGNDGLCEILSNILRTYSNNADTLIVQYACKIVTSLALSDTNSVKLCDCGACEAVVGVLKANISSETTTAAACKAVQSLIERNATNKVKLEDAGACEVVVRALKANISSVTTTAAACGGIASLAWSTGSVKLVDAGVCEAIVLALGRHTRSEDVARDGCHAIHLLSIYSPAYKRKLKAAGVRSVLKSVMKDHVGNQEILKRAQDASAAISS
jgi:hypothetical protein